MENQMKMNSNVLIYGRKPRVLLAATGSIATLKLPELATRLSLFFEVQIILTHASFPFMQQSESYNMKAWQEFINHEPNIKIIKEEEEWKNWKVIGDPILHISLRDWADIMLIAPLSANSLGKLANGLCDNLVTSVARAWNWKKPFLIAPAMNVHMWSHPITAKQLETLKEFGVIVIDPISKVLACGDEGKGAMASINDIANKTLEEILKL